MSDRWSKRAPKGPPPSCTRCKTPENVVPATNYGRPNGEWWCSGCGSGVGRHEPYPIPDTKPTGTAAIGLSAEIEAWNGDRWGDLVISRATNL